MVNKKIVLHFPKKLVNEAIVYKLIKDYNLSFNILKAQILPDREGLMVMELHGSKKDFQKGIKYLENSSVRMQPLSRDVRRDEDKCTHCGVCVAMCPTDALRMEEKTKKVIFDSDKCIACELCIDPCPPKAMELHF